MGLKGTEFNQEADVVFARKLVVLLALQQWFQGIELTKARSERIRFQAVVSHATRPFWAKRTRWV